MQKTSLHNRLIPLQIFRGITGCKYDYLHFITAICVFGAIAGCSSQTVIESPPVGATLECDSRLVGTWTAARDRTETAWSPDLDLVTPDCRFLKADDGKADEDLGYLNELDFDFLIGSNNNYAIARAEIASESKCENPKDGCGNQEEECDLEDGCEKAEPAWAVGYHIVRYSLNNDRLYAYFIDDVQLSKLIKRKKISGRTEVEKKDGEVVSEADIEKMPSLKEYDESGEYYIRNFVRGSSKDITKYINDYPEMFYRTPSFVFKRISTRTLIEQQPIEAPERSPFPTKPVQASTERSK